MKNRLQILMKGDPYFPVKDVYILGSMLDNPFRVFKLTISKTPEAYDLYKNKDSIQDS